MDRCSSNVVPKFSENGASEADRLRQWSILLDLLGKAAKHSPATEAQFNLKIDSVLPL